MQKWSAADGAREREREAAKRAAAEAAVQDRQAAAEAALAAAAEQAVLAHPAVAQPATAGAGKSALSPYAESGSMLWAEIEAHKALLEAVSDCSVIRRHMCCHAGSCCWGCLLCKLYSPGGRRAAKAQHYLPDPCDGAGHTHVHASQAGASACPAACWALESLRVSGSACCARGRHAVWVILVKQLNEHGMPASAVPACPACCPTFCRRAAEFRT